MPKLRKTKIINHSLIGDKFVIATTVHGKNGDKTLHGEPRIEVTDEFVTMGCMKLTHEALQRLATLAKHFRWTNGYTYQEGNY